MSEVADGPETPAISVNEHPPRENPWIASFGKCGAKTEMICAGFAFAAGSHPLLSFLPPMIHLRGAETESAVYART